MEVNFQFLAIFTMPLLGVGFSLLIYGVLNLIGEIVAWILGNG